MTPDLFTSAKGIAGGLPMGALLAQERFAQVFQPGTHASTFGGNPVSAGAPCAVCDLLVHGDVMGRAITAERLRARLGAIRGTRPGVIPDLRGRGLRIARSPTTVPPGWTRRPASAVC